MDAGAMAEDCGGLQRLLERLYHERGFDFRGYKESTVARRTARRLRARGVDTYARYASVLDQDPTEYDRLFNDLTINVTSFFRDTLAFQALDKMVLPVLTGNGSQGRRWTGESEQASSEEHVPSLQPHPLRIWSAGCATGEEPYSVAMLLLEMLGPEIALRDIAIVGTDVDSKALDRAARGWFAPRDMEGIPPISLDRYFVREGDSFRVRPLVTRLVSFETHDLVKDPPYHDLDLVVCRNVLIYFGPVLQSQVLKRFHQALKDGGFLMLGKAETPIGETRLLFDCVDKKAKLFRKAAGVRRDTTYDE
jgi:chemotaxis methyl-accepting protein methylase